MSRVAAVDVGTNSVRLLVAEANPDGVPPLTPVDRQLRITRLGSGLDAAGHFDDEALERTLECVGDYAVRWTELGAGRVRVAATSAVRDAADRERFLREVQARTGETVEVLSGAQEAALAFRGAVTGLGEAAGEGPWLVLDIGGGSTEFVLGETDVEVSTSRQLGCVRLTERCLPADPPDPEHLRIAMEEIRDELEGAAGDIDGTRARTLIGVAGTVTTLAALHLGLGVYDPGAIHATRLPQAAVTSLVASLAGMKAAERARLGPMAPGREDVIVAGGLILQAVMQFWSFPDVVVSEADILDGLALTLLER